MRRVILLGIYNLLFPLVSLVAAPAWLLKMKKRGGLSAHLWERLGMYDRDAEFEQTGGIYLHAVSVGEVLMAMKLIRYWEKEDSHLSFVLAATTSTGFDLACAQAGEGVRVIYSPLDMPWLVRRVLRRFEPRLVVLIDSELWPNLLDSSNHRQIPVALVNARLSPRSERRHRRLNWLTRPFLSLLKGLCAQASDHVRTWEDLGVPAECITVTGSLKFDPEGQDHPAERVEFSDMLQQFGPERNVVLLASSHAGEEALLCAPFLHEPEVLLMVVPRHAERRYEVRNDLEAIGFSVVLRSAFHRPDAMSHAVFVVDTTGELRDWTAHADLVVIGKSFLSTGGQNPTEAIVADKPVLTGPHMENFEPLVSQLREAKGVQSVHGVEGLREEVHALLRNPERRKVMVQAAKEVLASHRGATRCTVEALQKLL